MMFATIFIVSMILLCYLAGIFLLLKGIGEIRQGLAARSWPTAHARLEKCTVEARGTGGSGIVYQVAVKYAYSVDGVRHTGDQVAIGYGASSNRAAHDDARRRMLGMKPFMVRYQPAKHAVSTIFASENALLSGTLVFGLLWLGFAICFTILVLAISGVGSTMLAWFG